MIARTTHARTRRANTRGSGEQQQTAGSIRCPSGSRTCVCSISPSCGVAHTLCASRLSTSAPCVVFRALRVIVWLTLLWVMRRQIMQENNVTVIFQPATWHQRSSPPEPTQPTPGANVASWLAPGINGRGAFQWCRPGTSRAGPQVGRLCQAVRGREAAHHLARSARRGGPRPR